MPIRRAPAKEGIAVSAQPKTSSSALRSPPAAPGTPIERLRALREMVTAEGNAILSAASMLTPEAVRAAEMTAQCEGCVIVTGVGKAGLVGQKLVATLASTGSPAHFLHPSEAVHGDLGRVREDDIVWAISNSGRSEEIVRIGPHLRQHSSGLIAITATDDNPLAAVSDCVVAIGKHDEACPNGLAPTSSTAVMMAVGDAIAMLASERRSFTPQDFARYHPGGALGRKLATVLQIMRPIDVCRVAATTDSVRDAMVTRSKSGRRTGAVMLIDDDGRLTGIFTDSDLAKLLETKNDAALDDPIKSRMSVQPTTADADTLLQDAIAIMSHRRISELPIIDNDGRPLGLVDITDLVSLTDSSDSRSTISIT
jgi:arabinose-5-phosphate isomerase